MSLLHIELTSKCTLRCHACPRTIYAGEYKICELPFSSIEKLASSLKNYTSLLLCGNHGDPIYHTQFHQVLELFIRKAPHLSLFISTSGSHRSEVWWERTAEILRPQDVIIFGIDGLPENYTKYRVNSDWESIAKGVHVLKKKGSCQLVWKWIAFNYNKEMIEKGIQKAKVMGFDKFDLTFSSRHEGDQEDFQLSESKASIKERLENGGFSTLQK